jgi:hypothetical protein
MEIESGSGVAPAALAQESSSAWLPSQRPKPFRMFKPKLKWSSMSSSFSSEPSCGPCPCLRRGVIRRRRGLPTSECQPQGYREEALDRGPHCLTNTRASTYAMPRVSASSNDGGTFRQSSGVCIDVERRLPANARVEIRAARRCCRATDGGPPELNISPECLTDRGRANPGSAWLRRPWSLPDVSIGYRSPQKHELQNVHPSGQFLVV